jgi:hypothetical protein
LRGEKGFAVQLLEIQRFVGFTEGRSRSTPLVGPNTFTNRSPSRSGGETARFRI